MAAEGGGAGAQEERLPGEMNPSAEDEYPDDVTLKRACGLYPPPEAGFHAREDGFSPREHDDGSADELSRDATPAGGAALSTASDEEMSPTALPPSTKGAVVWHAKVLTDDVVDKRFCLPSGELKPRRSMPIVRVSELLKGLRQQEGRWIFDGPLNGWPSLRGLELLSLTVRESNFGFKSVRRLWKASEGKPLPEAAQIPKRTRATFGAPAWTAVGWAPDSPGFVWWFARQASGAQRVLVGERLIEQLQAGPYGNADAVNIHVFAHRYVVAHETLRDTQTWHTGALVEWSHGEFLTLFELAWFNGCGGYLGRSNWCEDKLANPTELYQAMPEIMKGPWNSSRSEIRAYDLPLRKKEEFEAFLQKYSEKGSLPQAEQRFLEPRIYASAPVRLRWCSAAHLAGYMLNYVRRASKYETLRTNCQTFAADLFAFLAGKRDHVPFGAIVRPVYKQRTHAFLYLPH